MSHFFQQIEAALLPAAIPYTPEGIDPKAVVHPSMHKFSPLALEQNLGSSILKKYNCES